MLQLLPSCWAITPCRSPKTWFKAGSTAMPQAEQAACITSPWQVLAFPSHLIQNKEGCGGEQVQSDVFLGKCPPWAR